MRNEVKVGLFLFLGILSLLFLTFQINSFKKMAENGYTLYALIDDASGLNKKAKVKLKGVDVGYVENLFLDNNLVKIKMVIKKGVKIPVGTKVTLSQNNLLGGKYVRLIPSDSTIYYKPGDIIKNFVKLATMEDVMDNVNKAVEDLKVLISKVNSVLDKNTSDNIKTTIYNIKDSSFFLKSTLKSINEKINPLLDNYNQVAINLNNSIPTLSHKTNKLLDEFYKTGRILNEKLNPLMEESLNVVHNANQLLVENQKPLNDAIESATEFFSNGGESFKKLDNYLSSLTKSQLYVDIQENYLTSDNNFKTDVTLYYLPTPTKYYILGATSREISQKNEIYINAEYGKRFDNLLLRGGIIQSTGGIGFDYFFNKDRFMLSSSIYDFNGINNQGSKPHLDVSFIYRYLKHIEFISGVDNILNTKHTNLFLGVGVTFKDNDLKPFLGGASSFLK